MSFDSFHTLVLPVSANGNVAEEENDEPYGVVDDGEGDESGSASSVSSSSGSTCSFSSCSTCQQKHRFPI